MLEQKEIENPWCVYGWFLGLWGFGKIERESKHSVEIRYSEDQMYPLELWGLKWIKRFGTLEETVEHYIENRPAEDTRWGGDTTMRDIRKLAEQKFPSYFKNKK